MRHTVPWVPPPPTREPSDDDELGGNAIGVALFVGALVRRHRRPVDASVLATAVHGLFEPGLARKIDEVEVVEFVGASIMLAYRLGLIALDERLCWRPVERLEAAP